ncbi:MAG TPA: hypothetical protein VLJ16_00400 [Acidobacteriota bacterium]|nr:hypothetical protein [Acidobacteriota bacterium]
MSMKKIVSLLFLPLLLASFLHSQSLADLAKKEKERRAALKGKATTVVTSADIAKVKKRPAVEATGAQAAEGEAAAGEGAAATPPEGAPQTAAAAPPEKAAPVPETPAEDAAAKSAAEIQKKQKELADAAQEKIELVELLNLKLNALYQEFQGLDNIKTREIIQQQISDTYDKLLKAETDSAKAQKDLEDFMAEVAKKKTSPIWIR